MRKAIVLVGLSVAVAFVLRVAPSAQSVATGYLTPPKVVADIMDAEPLPAVTLSPDRRTMLLLASPQHADDCRGFRAVLPARRIAHQPAHQRPAHA